MWRGGGDVSLRHLSPALPSTTGLRTAIGAPAGRESRGYQVKWEGEGEMSSWERRQIFLAKYY